MIVLIVVFAVGVLATSVGLTAALWSDVGGDSGIAPQADSTDWNYWVKYFIFERVGGNYEIIGFSGTTLENVIIPTSAMGGTDSDGNVISIDAAVTAVRNSVFADSTLKALPVTISIPAGITVYPAAFSGLTSLTRVTFGGGTNATSVGASAFAGCPSLTTVEFATTANVRIAVDAFAGCISLNSASLSEIQARFSN